MGYVSIDCERLNDMKETLKSVADILSLVNSKQRTDSVLYGAIKGAQKLLLQVYDELDGLVCRD